MTSYQFVNDRSCLLLPFGVHVVRSTNVLLGGSVPAFGSQYVSIIRPPSLPKPTVSIFPSWLLCKWFQSFHPRLMYFFCTVCSNKTAPLPPYQSSISRNSSPDMQFIFPSKCFQIGMACQFSLSLSFP